MRFKHKLDNFIWFIVYTLPFFILAITAIMNMGATERITVDSVMASWDTFMPTLNSGIGKIFKDIINYFNVDSVIIDYALKYVVYLIIAHFIKILELVILLLVHMTENLIDKITFKKE